MLRTFAIALFAATTAASVLAQAPAEAGSADKGKALYMKNGCYECHGTVGQGGTGPKLAPPVRTAAALIAYVRRPAGQMPPYTAKVMPDSELNDVRAYLATIPEPPKSPLLNP
jgi:ubiquinol-cytochrome c reductase cytochrome c subunit